MRRLLVLAGLALGISLAFLVHVGRSGPRAPTSSAARATPAAGGGASPAAEATSLPAGGGAAAAGMPRPPRFVGKPAKQVESDATKPGYDPLDLQAIGNKTIDIFRSEPRSEPWAGKMEKALGAQVTSDITHFSKKAKVKTTECRSSSCLVTVDAPDDELKIISLALQLVQRGDMQEGDFSDDPVGEGWHRQTLYVGVRPANRNLDHYAKWQKEWRTRQLGYLRSHPEAFSVWKIGDVQVPAE